MNQLLAPPRVRPDGGHPQTGGSSGPRLCLVPTPARALPTILADCRVADLERGTFEHADLVVRGDVIESVRRFQPAPHETEVPVVHLEGAWIVPGLIDAHAHLSGAADGPVRAEQLNARLAAYLRTGVTTIRDAGARDHSVLALAAATRAPRIVASGCPIRHSTPAAAATAAGSNVKAGAAWLKAYELESAELAAVLDVAGATHLPVGAHLGDDPAGSLDLGLEAVEHVYTLIRHDLVPLAMRLAPTIPAADTSVATWFLSDPEASWTAPWYESVGARRPFVTSTLLVMRALKGHRAAIGPEVGEPPSWASQGEEDRWRARLDSWGWWSLGPGSSPEVRDLAFENICRTERRLAVAGARVCLGTDFGEPFVEPGVGVLEEMKLLRAAGLSTLDVVRSATTIPADLLNLRGQIGTLAAGARADAVALAANPLECIDTLGAPVLVMAAGAVVIDRTSQLRLERSA